tara:strand:+ start:1687 stop:2058 length:372 start_codon:yes stop_codon:yes gene_type:complete
MQSARPFSEEGLIVGCTYRSNTDSFNIYVASDPTTLVYRNYTLKSTREYFINNFFITDCSVREIVENWKIDVKEFDRLVHHFMNLEELRQKAIIRYRDVKDPNRHRPEITWFDKVRHKYTRGH